MGVYSDAKYFLNVFPGQKAQITDCQVTKQITLSFTHEHTFVHSLYKCLLITHHVPGAENSAVSELDTAPVFLAFTLTLACAHGVSDSCVLTPSAPSDADLLVCVLRTDTCCSCPSHMCTFLNFAVLCYNHHLPPPLNARD